VESDWYELETLIRSQSSQPDFLARFEMAADRESASIWVSTPLPASAYIPSSPITHRVIDVLFNFRPGRLRRRCGPFFFPSGRSRSAGSAGGEATAAWRPPSRGEPAVITSAVRRNLSRRPIAAPPPPRLMAYFVIVDARYSYRRPTPRDFASPG